MTSKYGRVQSDKIPISSPADAVEYTDDINANGYNRNGNGIYNDPVYTVETAPKPYRDTFGVCCLRCKNTARNKFMLCGAVLVLAIVLILIIVAASHSKSGSGKPMLPKESYGLVAYGPDSSGNMKFNPLSPATYMDDVNRMEQILDDYSAVDQLSHLGKYVKCHDNTTHIDESEICMQTTMEFGSRCQNYDLYGLHSGQPCVLLVLRLKKGEIPVPLDTYNDAVPPGRYSNQSVSISCAGKTEEDNKALGIGGSRLQGPPVDYNPETGFPLYYFQLRNNNKDWIDPAVMVQFNDPETGREISVKCVAWAQNFNDGQPQNSPIYSTEFKFNISK